MIDQHGLRGGLRVFLIAGLVWALTAIAVTAQTEGPKQAQRLVKRAGNTVKAITDARIQIQKTLDGYNEILGEVEDRRKIYKRLVRDVDRSDKRVATLRDKVTEMNGEANLYFADWAKSVDGILDLEVKERSQARLDSSRGRYADILELARLAGVEYEAFMSALRDQILYLGHDLNPAGVDSVSEDAKKLNERGTELFTKIEKTTAAFGQYMHSLRPE